MAKKKAFTGKKFGVRRPSTGDTPSSMDPDTMDGGNTDAFKKGKKSR